MTGYLDVFDAALCELAAAGKNVAAVADGNSRTTGLHRFRAEYPKRFFDGETAGGHPVSFAADLAAAGAAVVVEVTSAGLWRHLEQMVYDAAMKKRHVIFAVREAGLAAGGEEERQGIFHFSCLSQIPGMTVMAPKNRWELEDMLSFAVSRLEGPSAICFPGGEASDEWRELRTPVRLGKGEVLYDEKGIALLAAGSMVKTAADARRRLRRMGYSCSLVNVRFIKPLDEALMMRMAREHELLVTLEENVRTGGLGDHLLELLSDTGMRVRVINAALPDLPAEEEESPLTPETAGIGVEAVLQRIIAEYAGLEMKEG